MLAYVLYIPFSSSQLSSSSSSRTDGYKWRQEITERFAVADERSCSHNNNNSFSTITSSPL